MTDLIKAGFPPLNAAHKIYEKDIDELLRSDLLLVILDGRSIDEGASFELGFMKSLY